MRVASRGAQGARSTQIFAGKLFDQYKLLASELGIAERCIFYGFVPHWDVPEFMRRLNFLVSASRYESFGMAILEAIACGLPVVATRCGGPEDFITKECGILVPAEDIAKLREAIEWMMNHHHSFDPPQLKRYVSEQFSAGAIVEKMNAIYSSALGSKQERT